MPQLQIDSKGLRSELSALPRGTLLIIAERAIELVTQDQLAALLGDIIHVNAYATATDANSVDAATIVGTSLLKEVRSFHDVAMDEEYYEHIEINSSGQCEQSRGTDAFIAEFDRLMRKCVAASEADTGPDVGNSFAHEENLLRTNAAVVNLDDAQVSHIKIRNPATIKWVILPIMLYTVGMSFATPSITLLT